MDYGKLLSDSFAYTKDGFFRNPITWVLLIILGILPVVPFIIAVIALVPALLIGAIPDIPTLIVAFAGALIMAIILGALYIGYQVKIYRGETPLPDVAGFGRMFTDGIKYCIIEIIYAIPVLIIMGVTIGTAVMSILSAGLDFEAWLPMIGTVLLGILIALIVGFIIRLFSIIGIVRFARTGSIGEAFNFHEILKTIRRIGWGGYILALILVIVIIAVVEFIIGIIPYIGWILTFILSPLFMVFFARYIALLYDANQPADTQQPLPPEP